MIRFSVFNFNSNCNKSTEKVNGRKKESKITFLTEIFGYNNIYTRTKYNIRRNKMYTLYRRFF